MRTLLSALKTYRDTYSAYPEELNQLGPPAAGSSASVHSANLIDSALASGVKSGYRFLYVPGPLDLNGMINTFAIVARPVQYEGPGTPSLTATESGIIRQTTEDRAATDADPALH